MASKFKSAKHNKPSIYGLIKPKDIFEKNILDIIISCLQYNPFKRPKLDDIITKIKSLQNLTVDKKETNKNTKTKVINKSLDDSFKISGNIKIIIKIEALQQINHT